MKNLVNKYIIAGTVGVLAVASNYLVKPFEGQVLNKNGEHVVYKDIVGVTTGCFGMTGKDLSGESLKVGNTYSNEYCEEWLQKELAVYNKAMKKHIKVPITPYEEVAYTSFVWNLGETNFKNSTLVGKLNKGDNLGACKELLNWDRVRRIGTLPPLVRKGEECYLMADKKSYSCKVRGLTNRREFEYEVCIGKNSAVNDALRLSERPADTPINQDQWVAIVKDVIPVVEPSSTCKWSFFNLCLKREWKG